MLVAEQRKSGTGRTIVAALVTVAAPVALYFAVRGAVAGLDPAATAGLPPADLRWMARQVAIASADPRRRLAHRELALAKSAVLSAPLAAEPFFIAARLAEQGGNLNRAIELLEEMRRRRPSFLPGRLQLLAYYIQARRFPPALREIDFALRVSDETRRVLLPELAKLIREPDARRDLAGLLAANPPWKSDFFNVARNQNLRPADALALLNLARARTRDVSAEEGLYLHTLLASGRDELARQAWLESLAPAERQRNRLIFDAAFQGSTSGREFGWTLHSRDVGRADIIPANAGGPYLNVSYHGGTGAVLAEQRLALRPGRYRLSATGRTQSNVTSGQLLWTIACARADRPLVSLPPSAPTGPATASASFAVPSGCTGQTLSLIGEPGDIAAFIEARFSRVDIADER